eukprot:gene42004-45801_t
MVAAADPRRVRDNATALYWDPSMELRPAGSSGVELPCPWVDLRPAPWGDGAAVGEGEVHGASVSSPLSPFFENEAEVGRERFTLSPTYHPGQAPETMVEGSFLPRR